MFVLQREVCNAHVHEKELISEYVQRSVCLISGRRAAWLSAHPFSWPVSAWWGWRSLHPGRWGHGRRAEEERTSDHPDETPERDRKTRWMALNECNSFPTAAILHLFSTLVNSNMFSPDTWRACQRTGRQVRWRLCWPWPGWGSSVCCCVQLGCAGLADCFLFLPSARPASCPEHWPAVWGTAPDLETQPTRRKLDRQTHVQLHVWY